MLSIRVRCCRIVQATKGNFDWLVIAGYVYDLPAVIVPDMIWAESTMVVDILSLQSGEPSDAVEHATWLFGDGIIARACRLIRNDYEVLSLTRGVWPLF